MNNDYLGIVAVVGEEGTGKTGMALSFPKPLFHLDIDVGGFWRAAWRLVDKRYTDPIMRIYECKVGEDISKLDWSQYDIVTKPYPKPIQMDKLIGQLTEPSTRAIKLNPKKVEGMKELWQDIVIDAVSACQSSLVKTIIIDSGTLFWNICHNSHLQELQERQLAAHKSRSPNLPFNENDFRERLQPVEYGPANDRMRTVFHTARSFQKNLVTTHYPTDKYGMVADGKGGMVEGKTGELVLDGFKETVRLADVVLWLRITETVLANKTKEKCPMAKFTKCGISGMGLDAVGTEIIATYEGIVYKRSQVMGVRK